MIQTPTSGSLASPIETIYSALRLGDLQTDRPIYTSGDEVVLTYALINKSDNTLVVPLNTDFSQPYYLIGSEQYWIERLGPNSTIPGIPAVTGRYGIRYAAGGAIIPVDWRLGKRVILPAEGVPMGNNHSTKGYPPGQYRLYVEYKRLSGEIVDTASVMFEIQGVIPSFTPTPTA